ncbi:hypothetical protein [Catalinimonas niigatensis]|uniref:hypothetical protein n=1 Tax=Catalinimonas niigatensis TaxID=1397264 RepID=UPI0026657299|nr:hypothetical protein [Catalinimonas niigatensis]WPP52914.1 hypothetical protein PZB72_11055 [Catalinimonas niigatensis]
MIRVDLVVYIQAIFDPGCYADAIISFRLNKPILHHSFRDRFRLAGGYRSKDKFSFNLCFYLRTDNQSPEFSKAIYVFSGLIGMKEFLCFTDKY